MQSFARSMAAVMSAPLMPKRFFFGIRGTRGQALVKLGRVKRDTESAIGTVQLRSIKRRVERGRLRKHN